MTRAVQKMPAMRPPIRACLFLAVALCGASALAQGRARAILQFEGVPERFASTYGAEALVRNLRATMLPPDQAMAEGALQALGRTAAQAFQPERSVAAIEAAVAAANPGGTVAPEAVQAAARVDRLRAEFQAMDEPARQALAARCTADEPARAALLGRMASGELRETDIANHLLMTSAVKNLARNSGVGGLPTGMIDSAIDSAWSRGATSDSQRQRIAMAREVEGQINRMLLCQLDDAQVQALLALRSDAAADAEREALVHSYHDEVRVGSTRTLRTLARAVSRR